jgi:cardiolipin synthase
VGERTAARTGQYSDLLPWLAAAVFWSPLADAQSTRVLDEVIEKLTKAPLYDDNAVELLLDGPQTHQAMLDAIESAEHHVHLETYIFADDEVGTEFATALEAKAREGVAVRVIFDSIGSRGGEDGFWAGLEDAGVVVREFNPPDPVQDQNPFDIDTRDHRKLLVVDGRVAFTGGINIDRNYVRASDVVGGRSASSGWRDTHIRIEGPAVAAFQQLFVAMWEKLDGPLAEPPYSPPPRRLDRGNTRVRVLAGVV